MTYKCMMPSRSSMASSRAGRCQSVCQHRADIGLGDDLAIYLGVAMEPPHRLFPADQVQMIFDRIARHHRLAKLALVDGEEIHRTWLLGAFDGRDPDHARCLSHAF